MLGIHGLRVVHVGGVFCLYLGTKLILWHCWTLWDITNNRPLGSVKLSFRCFPVLVNHAAHTVFGRASANLFWNVNLLRRLWLDLWLVQVKWGLSFLHWTKRSRGKLIRLIPWNAFIVLFFFLLHNLMILRDQVILPHHLNGILVLLDVWSTQI